MAVYIIRAGEFGPVKIGFSDDIDLRLVKMQADNHERLTVLRRLAGDESVEAALHERFAASRLRGEWFAFHADMLGDLGFEDLAKPAPIESEPPPVVSPLPSGQSVVDIADANIPVMDAMDLIRSKRGLMARIARELGLTRAAVGFWGSVPAERLPEIERITGIPRHQLRPDICSPPVNSEAA